MKIVKIQNTTYEVVIGDIHARPIQASVDGETIEVYGRNHLTFSFSILTN